MFNPLKRKTDDKPRHRPHHLRSGVLQAVAVALSLIIGAALWFVFRPAPFALFPHFPASPLTYHSDDARYSVNLQTGERTPTHSIAAAIERGAWSPDERWMAYWEGLARDTVRELMVGEFQKLSTTRSFGKFTSVSPLSWSADSKHLIFSAHNDSDRADFCDCEKEIFVLSRETGEVTRLTDNAYMDTEPMFSPDRPQIVYVSTADGYQRLYIMDFVTGESRLLTPDLVAASPVWSPDGQWIAFVTTSYDTNGDIWMTRPDGTDAQPVITGPTREHYPAWESGRKMPYQA